MADRVVHFDAIEAAGGRTVMPVTEIRARSPSSRIRPEHVGIIKS